MLKYIPLVKHTSCTIMLDMPALDLSVVMLPIKIPSDINKIDIINEISESQAIAKVTGGRNENGKNQSKQQESSSIQTEETESRKNK